MWKVGDIVWVLWDPCYGVDIFRAQVLQADDEEVLVYYPGENQEIWVPRMFVFATPTTAAEFYQRAYGHYHDRKLVWKDNKITWEDK